MIKILIQVPKIDSGWPEKKKKKKKKKKNIYIYIYMYIYIYIYIYIAWPCEKLCTYIVGQVSPYCLTQDVTCSYSGGPISK